MEIIRKLKDVYIFEKIYKYVMQYKKSLVCDEIDNYKQNYLNENFINCKQMILRKNFRQGTFYTFKEVNSKFYVNCKEFEHNQNNIVINKLIKRKLDISEKYLKDTIQTRTIHELKRAIDYMVADPNRSYARVPNHVNCRHYSLINYYLRNGCQIHGKKISDMYDEFKNFPWD